MRQNPGTANALATKMYEENLKLPVQRDSLDDGALKVQETCYLIVPYATSDFSS